MLTNLFLGMGFVRFPSSLWLWEIMKLSLLFMYGQLSKGMCINAHCWTENRQRFKEHNKTFIHFTPKKWHHWRERAKGISGPLLSSPLLVLRSMEWGTLCFDYNKTHSSDGEFWREKEQGINHTKYFYLPLLTELENSFAFQASWIRTIWKVCYKKTQHLKNVDSLIFTKR